MDHHQYFEALFRPKSAVFIGGSNLKAPLRFHSELGFAGRTYVVNPRYPSIEGYNCIPSIEDLPEAPDLAFIAISKERTLDTVYALRALGTKAVISNAAGYAETGADGKRAQAELVKACGDMLLIGPNAIGITNFVQPFAAMMDHFGVEPTRSGAAFISQGGGLLCDVVFCDRGLKISHLVGCGNQAATTTAEVGCWLVDDPAVTAIALSFEGLPETASLRKLAHKAQQAGKPVIAYKVGRSQTGIRAIQSHTASMAGENEAWQALLKSLSIVSCSGMSEFFETVKLLSSGQIPKGNKLLLTAASGVMGITVTDQFSDEGLELPQPSLVVKEKLKKELPKIATPCNPQDITMAAWNDVDSQEKIYNTLFEDPYDLVVMAQNYPKEGMWDKAEFDSQAIAFANAAKIAKVPALLVSPLVDCFPAQPRRHCLEMGLIPMQGTEETAKAIAHAVWWHASNNKTSIREHVKAAPALFSLDGAVTKDEAQSKAWLGEHDIPTARYRLGSSDQLGALCDELNFPLVLKGVHPKLLHKSDVGAVRLPLNSKADVVQAAKEMVQRLKKEVPQLGIDTFMLEEMVADPIGEIMVSIRQVEPVGPILLLAAGGREAELWQDKAYLALPAGRADIEEAFNSLKSIKRLQGYRGGKSGDIEALTNAVCRLVNAVSLSEPPVAEIEINPFLVLQQGVVAADAVLTLCEER